MKPLHDTTIHNLTSQLEQEDNFVFLESSRLSKENHQSFLFRKPSAHLCCHPGDSVSDFLHQVDQIRYQGQYLAGWLAYEFGYLLEPCLRHFLCNRLYNKLCNRPLAMLGVYDAPLIFDHANGLFRNGTGWPMQEEKKSRERSSYSCTDVTTTITRQEYIQALQAIQEYIRAGDTYQVNFTLHYDFSFQGSVAALYRALRRNQSVAYTAWIRQNGQDILSFSPELFFTADEQRVRVRPMKGTMSRGRTNAEDRVHQQQLRNDPKNQSENVMIVDLLRNDLGRLLYADEQENEQENEQKRQGKTQGRVEPHSLFDVEIYESLLQMTSTVDGIVDRVVKGATRDADHPLSFQRLIQALFPCGSVTGAPKIRTMEIIHELEKQPRGVYCGAIGYTGPDQSCFNVPIRTLELHKGQGRMGIGSGIIADSDAEAEWEECLLKGTFLTKSKAEFQLIETMLWQPEQGYFLLEYHLERLQDAAHYFHFYCDFNEISQALDRVSAEFSEGIRKKTCAYRQQRVRLLLHRDGHHEISSVPLPDPSENVSQQKPAKVLFSLKQVERHDPYLFHKTTQRQLYNDAFHQAKKQGYVDILFTNTAGEVTEGAISNIFIRSQKNEPLVTPPVHCGLLAGTYRRMLLEQGRAVERVLRREDLFAAEEVYLANSVRGLVPVQLCKN
ncbi:MAG: aminodeoxychorismate synthase, component I [Candidatus Electrothrix sp. AW1]|nr:aminodeoxychorismate synthase, component I [Candidatus Electrothrix gigas]